MLQDKFSVYITVTQFHIKTFHAATML